tara:strand:- start:6982 stop:7683 length:702 start_codon:yes stop_codon:yes gene_type:complete
MKNIAFVFARGGSKGLPKKNIKLLNGKPLIQYAIELARSSTRIEKIFVSTDNSEISKISSNLGAIVINRPSQLAADNSPEWLSWQHAIEFVHNNYGKFDSFISLPPTSPLRNIEDLDNGINLFDANKNADICISITEAHRSPYFNMVTKDNNGFIKLVNQTNTTISRRQDAPVVYDITTVMCIAKPSFILKVNNLFDGNVIGFSVPKYRSIDVDDIYDFKFAEFMLKEGINEK